MIHDHAPSLGLGALVERFRLVRGVEAPEGSTLELPVDCHFGLGFLLWDTGQTVVAGGPNTAPYSARTAHGIEYVWIRFRSGRMPRLVDAQASDLVDGCVRDFPRLLGERTESICDRLRAVEGLAAKQALLEGLLRPWLERPLCQDRRCVRALDMIEACEGRIQVAEVARELGLSPRSLQRMFLDQVGMTPKQFVRHLRFQRTLRRLERTPATGSLGRLAQVCGYADQSHLIHEFRVLAGRLPTTFLPGGPPA